MEKSCSIVLICFNQYIMYHFTSFVIIFVCQCKVSEIKYLCTRIFSYMFLEEICHVLYFVTSYLRTHAETTRQGPSTLFMSMTEGRSIHLNMTLTTLLSLLKIQQRLTRTYTKRPPSCRISNNATAL
jgi:hypothetical protein